MIVVHFGYIARFYKDVTIVMENGTFGRHCHVHVHVLQRDVMIVVHLGDIAKFYKEML